MNNYTTVEQSQALLEAGLDMDTADAVYIKHCTSDNPEWRFDGAAPMLLNDGKKVSDVAANPENLLPCWTTGQLLKLLPRFSKPTAFSEKLSIPLVYRNSYAYIVEYTGDYAFPIDDETGKRKAAFGDTLIDALGNQ